MPNPIIESLKIHPNPHEYLLRAGLSKETYDATKDLSSTEKESIVKKIIENATHEEVLQIIQHLAELEFIVESENPFRSGNRLAAQLINAYVSNIESKKFVSYMNNKENHEFANYDPDVKIKDLFSIINQTANNQLKENAVDYLEKKFTTLPAFYYQQIFPSPKRLEEMKNIRELTRNETACKSFNYKLLKGTTPNITPIVFKQNETANFLSEQLADLKSYIEDFEWKTSKLAVFRGGTKDPKADNDHKNKLYPEGVLAILDILREGIKNNTTPEEIYKNIKDRAEQAEKKGKWGAFLRDPETAKFYENIISGKIFSDDKYRIPDIDEYDKKNSSLN